MNLKRLMPQFGYLVLLASLGGCATTGKDPQDPLEGWNRGGIHSLKAPTFNSAIIWFMMAISQKELIFWKKRIV